MEKNVKLLRKIHSTSISFKSECDSLGNESMRACLTHRYAEEFLKRPIWGGKKLAPKHMTMTNARNVWAKTLLNKWAALKQRVFIFLLPLMLGLFIYSEIPSLWTLNLVILCNSICCSSTITKWISLVLIVRTDPQWEGN